MKQLAILLILLIGIFHNGRSQTPDAMDSVDFAHQRQRVNDLLKERSKRFGAFDNSLQQKTGMFGLFKSKKDMQRSIDILREIVLTDNNIFRETKKLLDIKGNESDRNEHLALTYNKQLAGYMRTITKLQETNEKLQNQLKELETQQQDLRAAIIALISIILLCGTLFLVRRKPNKPKI